MNCILLNQSAEEPTRVDITVSYPVETDNVGNKRSGYALNGAQDQGLRPGPPLRETAL